MVTMLGARFPRLARRDVLLAAVCAVAVVAGSVLAADPQRGRSRPLDLVGIALLVVAATATVGLRRAAPMGALTGAVLVVNGYLLAGYPFGPVLLCLVVAVFEVARQRTLLVSAVSGGLAAVVSSATVLVRVLGDGHASGLLALAWAGWIVLPWSLGALVHVLDAARHRARQDLIGRIALAERTRLASEVHDIAGHGFALITMQAGVALLVFDGDPRQARRSLEAVRETSATALADLRRMLDTIHPDPNPYRPTPALAPPAELTTASATEPAGELAIDPAGVAGLAQLIQQVRAGGLPVEVVVDGAAELPEPVGATVFRVVQEALTNVLRHAGPTVAHVTINRPYQTHQATQPTPHVLIRVTDSGNGAPDTIGPPGRGLAGMRRRVEDLDGRLETGPREGGGFQVLAWLPMPERAR